MGDAQGFRIRSLTVSLTPPMPHRRSRGVAVRRNGYGRQRFSFEATVEVPREESMVGVFIRAPRIEAVDEGVEVVATLEGEPVAVASGSLIACAFHPELAGDDRLHRRLLDLR